MAGLETSNSTKEKERKKEQENTNIASPNLVATWNLVKTHGNLPLSLIFFPLLKPMAYSTTNLQQREEGRWVKNDFEELLQIWLQQIIGEEAFATQNSSWTRIL